LDSDNLRICSEGLLMRPNILFAAFKFVKNKQKKKAVDIRLIGTKKRTIRSNSFLPRDKGKRKKKN